jgi:uncharacterized membrane protein
VPLAAQQHPIYQDVRRVSGALSTYCFLLVFAAMGMSMDVPAALRGGPACLLFSLASLLVHAAITLVVCCFLAWWQRSAQFPSDYIVRWEDALIASNAAIGGPATAAAFCGQLPESNPRKAGLTLAATVYGVVGYAIGTTIGLTLFRILKNLS